MKQTILVVDKSESNFIAIKGIIANEEWPILHARTGFDGLKLMLEHDIDLVLLGVQIPDMDYEEIAVMMSQCSKTSTTPVIILSEMKKEQIAELKQYQAGAIDFIPNPINPNVLRSKAEFFMKLSKQKREFEEKISLAKTHMSNYQSSKAKAV